MATPAKVLSSIANPSWVEIVPLGHTDHPGTVGEGRYTNRGGHVLWDHPASRGEHPEGDIMGGRVEARCSQTPP